MFIFQILTILIIFISFVKLLENNKTIFNNKIFDKIDNEKIKRLNFIERREYFIGVLLEQDYFRKSVQVQGVQELEFETAQWITRNEFPCKSYSVPGSGGDVNKLTPSDINVMAAFGNSLIAGLGIDSHRYFDLNFEYRGKVFAIGGNPNAQTLPNFFRVYNPNVKGMSTKTTYIGSEGDELNVAVSGATSADLMNQLDNLLTRMRNEKSINMDKDWKMITIFIGNNDICRTCESGKAKDFTAQLFKERIEAVLDKLKAEVPRVFVNLITMLDVYKLQKLNIGLFCSLIHHFECPCVAYPENITKIIEVNTEFKTKVSEISDLDKYHDKNDFTVVTQPFLEYTSIPEINNVPDVSYFAQDCFHFSVKGHAQLALSLWNNLFEPIPLKKRTWNGDEKFKCPTKERPFLATKRNSV